VKLQLSKSDCALIALCRKAIEYEDNGDPASDVIDDDEKVEAIRLLLDILDSEGEGA
jgi:hypothetical protein